MSKDEEYRRQAAEYRHMAEDARSPVGLEATMKQSEVYRQHAENCVNLTEGATDEPTRQRYKRIEAAWRALADEQDWLEGEPVPVRKGGLNNKNLIPEEF